MFIQKIIFFSNYILWENRYLVQMLVRKYLVATIVSFWKKDLCSIHVLVIILPNWF